MPNPFIEFLNWQPAIFLGLRIAHVLMIGFVWMLARMHYQEAKRQGRLR